MNGMGGMGMLYEERPKRTEYLRKPTGVTMSVVPLSTYPSFDLSGQRLGGATLNDTPYLIGGNWNVVDLTGCSGHVVFHGYANRLILKDSCGIFVRVFGAVSCIDARNLGSDTSGHHSWIELNGDIFEIDLRGNSIQGLELSRGIGGCGDQPSLEDAKVGKVEINPMSIRYVVSDDPAAWRRALTNAQRNLQEGLGLFAEKGRERKK